MAKLNCWEYFGCGREPRGKRCEAHGTCPASVDARLNGANSGVNGGRACWALTQTLCHGLIGDNLIEKMARCLECEFRRQVLREEGKNFVNTRDLLDLLEKSTPRPSM